MARINHSVTEMIERHASVGANKPLSYLPISTIEKVAGLSILEYILIIEKKKNKAIVVQENESIIRSGAVYAFNEGALSKLLNKNKDNLLLMGWPVSGVMFVKKLSVNWVEKPKELLDIIRQAFGDYVDNKD